MKNGLEDYYVIKNNKKLRYGYTTGSCAAAAAKAAARMLLTGEKVENIDLMTPKGILLHLEILDIHQGTEEVSCAVRKDGGTTRMPPMAFWSTLRCVRKRKAAWTLTEAEAWAG